MKFLEVISVPVSNQEVSKQFYLNIGFEVIIEAPMGNGSNWVQLGIPGQPTSISLVNWFTQMQPGGLAGVVIKTDDIEKDVAELKAKNVDVKDIDPTPWGKFATFYDPDGNSFVLREEE
jgi:catechol 2,3-dioxygenase-like lactoylglutathione lyase family enzyme